MSLLCRTDVTCVKVHSNLVLTGIGSYISIFEKQNIKLLCRCIVLRGQKIYGIIPCVKTNHKLLIFGGKQFRPISLDTDTKLDNCVSVTFLYDVIYCDDWIHSAVWTDDEHIALLTAHNVVQKWNIRTGENVGKYCNKNNSILYSGLILPLEDDMLVFAGTVYSKVIIHRCKRDEPLHYLEGHKGVIFSVIFNALTQTIVTTSDDRSVRMWQANSSPNSCVWSVAEYWEKIQIDCKHVLYGHTARVMRCTVNSKCIVSGGEDSAICFWSTCGQLLKRKFSHQNGCIWSIDSDEESVVTGGSDGGVQIHPLTIISEHGHHEIIDLKSNKPKMIAFTARGNIVMLCENNSLFYYETQSAVIRHVCQLNHKSTYKLMNLSSCKQFLAVADMTGQLDIFIENCKNMTSLKPFLSKKLQIGKILSLHWAGNRHLVFCCENGEISVFSATINDVDIYANFVLPQCKERWLTASAFDSVNKLFILGDRCGNIHFYMKGQKAPVKSLKKVHGCYGPTSLLVNSGEIISTGRDRTIKYFNVTTGNKLHLKYMSEINVNFDWVEMFLDKKHSLVCGFQEKVFVLYDTLKREKILEVKCGGGHRSWDAIRYFEKNDKYVEFVKLIYLKNTNLHVSTFQLHKIVSHSVISGTHIKEINCLSVYRSDLNRSITFVIAGGEDTTLRISLVYNLNEITYNDRLSFKHLSSVRTIKIYDLGHNKVLLISGGGRAQINIRILYFSKIIDEVTVKTENVLDYLIKGSDKDRKIKSWKEHNIDFDPETRIMSLDVIDNNNVFTIVVACSDAKLRLFELSFVDVEESTFRHIGDIEYHNTCILKVHCMQFLEKQLVMTMTTTGEVAFWDFSNKENVNIKPFLVIQANQAGINSFDVKILESNEIILVTGGDDNAICLIVLKLIDIKDLNSLHVTKKWETHKWHCAQVTGLKLLDTYLLSTSIDQRITLSQWSLDEDHISCQFLSQHYTDISDVQGLEVIEKSSEQIHVCVYGKGLEIIEINVPR